MGEYYCIRCAKTHKTDSIIGQKHICYVPIFGGIRTDKEEASG